MGILKQVKENRKRMALLSLAAIGVLGVGSFGAYSFFTDQGTIVNDFTTGRVDLQESETNWNPEEPGPDGQRDGDNLYPGYTRGKNPTVQNTAGITNNNAWIKATIKFLDQNGEQITDEARDKLIFETLKYDPDGTLQESDGKGNGKYDKATLDALKNINPAFGDAEVAEESEVGKHVFYLQEVLKSAATPEEGESVTLFTHIALPTEWTQDELDIMGDYHIEVTFDGIQEMGFDNVNDAMAALNAEANPKKDYSADDTNRDEDRLNQSGENHGNIRDENNGDTDNDGNTDNNTDNDVDTDADNNDGNGDQTPGGDDTQKPDGDGNGDDQTPDDGSDDNSGGTDGDTNGDDQLPDDGAGDEGNADNDDTKA